MNEDNLWTGDENPSGNYDTMGAYQVLGNVFVNLAGMTNGVDYRRELDWPTRFRTSSIHGERREISREFFCSHPAEILVAQFTADKKPLTPGASNWWMLTTQKWLPTATAYVASGTLDNGLKFEWQLLVLNQGGEVKWISGQPTQRRAN